MYSKYIKGMAGLQINHVHTDILASSVNFNLKAARTSLRFIISSRHTKICNNMNMLTMVES